MTMNKLSSSRLEGIHLQKSNLIQPGRAEAKEDAMHFPSDARATVVTLTMNRLSSCRRTSHFSKSDRPSSRSEPRLETKNLQTSLNLLDTPALCMLATNPNWRRIRRLRI